MKLNLLTKKLRLMYFLFLIFGSLTVAFTQIKKTVSGTVIASEGDFLTYQGLPLLKKGQTMGQVDRL